MATTERDFTSTEERFAVVADIGTVRLKRGHELRVTLKDAGHGIAIDIREHVTPEAYSDRDHDGVGTHLRGRGKLRETKKREPFIGATKKGVWLSSLDAAEELYRLLGDAIAEAAVNHA